MTDYKEKRTNCNKKYQPYWDREGNNYPQITCFMSLFKPDNLNNASPNPSYGAAYKWYYRPDPGRLRIGHNSKGSLKSVVPSSDQKKQKMDDKARNKNTNAY